MRNIDLVVRSAIVTIGAAAILCFLSCWIFTCDVHPSGPEHELPEKKIQSLAVAVGCWTISVLVGLRYYRRVRKARERQDGRWRPDEVS